MKKFGVFIIVSILCLIIMFLYHYVSFYDGKLHVVFCDVGQGDAIFIRTGDYKTIMVDGGPDRRVLSCLADHMPFWERKLDLLVLTHPHLDHFLGFYYVIDGYIAKYFVSEQLVNKMASYEELLEKIADRKIPQKIVHAGDRFKIGKDIVLSVEAPTTEFLQRTSPNGEIGESSEFASLILKLTYKEFDLVLTGDAQAGAMEEVARKNKSNIEVLQVPHHGSGTGLNKSIVERLAPRMAVVSVGKNRYGHPNRKIMALLEEAGVKILRTDEIGDIEIISDGKSFEVH